MKNVHRHTVAAYAEKSVCRFIQYLHTMVY